MPHRDTAVDALCRLDAAAVATLADEQVTVAAPDDRVARPGVADGLGTAALRTAVEALAAWSGGELRLDAQAHDREAGVLELATPDGRPVTVRTAWEGDRLADIRLYFDPEDTV